MICLCKSPIGASTTWADAGCCLECWWRWPGATRRCLPGGHALLHLGAFTATDHDRQLGNLIIISEPERCVVADLKAWVGHRTEIWPDRQAALAGTTNYLHLPVIL